jgi:hypothetical protein
MLRSLLSKSGIANPPGRKNRLLGQVIVAN